METTKLYYEDAYLREFDAAVLSCQEEQGRYLVVLDRTAFYPEGGGQPADHGVLGGVAVTDVQERNGVVCHTCAGPLAVGSTVHGAIDWQRRFDHMQQHSGEHIVSGMLCAAFHCDNVGFHMGTDVVTIDYNADIRWEQVLEVEQEANRYIWEDHPCRVTFPSPAEREALPYRSKKTLTGAVRLTEFPGADLCACCGTHVSGSGQVGLVKFLSCQKFREGVRLELVCGGRAMAHLCRSWQQKPIHRTAAVGEARRHRRSRGAAGPGGPLPEGPVRRTGGGAVPAAGRAVPGRRRGAAGAARSGRRRHPAAVRRREPHLRRAMRRVLRRGGAVSVRRHPSGSRPAGVREAYERRPPRSGRRTQRLRSGKRRRRRGDHPGILPWRVTSWLSDPSKIVSSLSAWTGSTAP